MKKILLPVLVIFISVILVCCEKPTERYVEVVIHDIPFQTEKYLRIGYTLKTWEFEKEGLELQQIKVIDHRSKERLMVLDKEDIPHIHKDPLPEKQFFDFDKLTDYYLSIQLPIPLGNSPPLTVSHLLLFKKTCCNTPVTVKGGVFSPRLNESPLVIASPLRRNNLAFINQSTMGYHFYVIFFVEGQLYRSERFAFDSLELDDGFTATYSGDPKLNASYFNYGSMLYAVADGVVVRIQDGLPENQGNARDVTFNSREEFAGNYIVLNIGQDRYAFYAHCIPGSFLVNVGDTVKEGDPLARLGNSGNSTEPHLHFQITDGPDVFFSNGIPFVLKEYIKIGGGEDEPVRVTPQRFTNAMMEQLTVFRVE